jgi:delta1-piperideine-2-carboxylate reductase
MPQNVSVGELSDLGVLLRHGVSPDNAGPLTETVVAAERAGTASHSLLRLPGYIVTLKSGWVDGRAVPVVVDAAPGLVATEAANGFAQPALRVSAALLRDKACRQGICRGSDPQLAPLRRGVAGHRAFAAARGDVLFAAERGEILPEGVGLDSAGRPTTDPRAMLDGGSALPFTGHKRSAIAFMIEIIARALTGGGFGFEDRSGEYPGAQTSKAGQTIILIDALLVPGNRYFERIEGLFAAIAESDVERLPAERRHFYLAPTYLSRAIFQYRSAADVVGEIATRVPMNSGLLRA